MNQQPVLPPLSKTTEVRCNQCDGLFFDQTTLIRKASRFLFVPAAPEDVTIPIPVLRCAQCGEILQETLPAQLRNKPTENGEGESKIII